ncbi:hypothetical protein NPIL_341001, partial [Nephila pilipes]
DMECRFNSDMVACTVFYSCYNMLIGVAYKESSGNLLSHQSTPAHIIFSTATT